VAGVSNGMEVVRESAGFTSLDPVLDIARSEDLPRDGRSEDDDESEETGFGPFRFCRSRREADATGEPAKVGPLCFLGGRFLLAVGCS
jgi:hypothetical protein